MEVDANKDFYKVTWTGMWVMFGQRRSFDIIDCLTFGSFQVPQYKTDYIVSVLLILPKVHYDDTTTSLACTI